MVRLVSSSPCAECRSLSDLTYYPWINPCRLMVDWPAKTLFGGQGHLVSSLIMGINGLTIWVLGVINLVTKSP